MPGFSINNFNEPIKLNNYDDSRCVQDQMDYKNYYIARNTLNKFMEDKLFFQNDENIVILEGVIFNKADMMHQFESWEAAMLSTIKKKSDEFFLDFRGMFSGAIYDKKKNEWIIFTDQLGEKAVFYYIEDGRIIVGSQLNYVTDTMKKLNIARTIDEKAFEAFMMYGNFIDDRTGIESVMRLYPGEYIKISDKGECQVCSYYKAEVPVNEKILPEEAIEQLDRAFKQSMQRAINKNSEYGYTNILDISGGLDSRIIAFTAKALSMKNAIMINYSQSKSDETKVAQIVANQLGYDFYYKSLDNASFMYEIDDILKMNSGTAWYYGITGGKQFLETLDSKSGIEFTGILGDMHDGGMILNNYYERPTFKYKPFRASKFVDFDIESKALEKFKRNETFWFYTRGMIAGMSTFLTRQNFLEPFTPFGDVEFMEVYLSIPCKMRVDGCLMRRWLVSKYPIAGQIKYAATGISVTSEMTTVGQCVKYLLRYYRKFKRKILGLKTVDNMNPINYWIKTMPKLRLFMQTYFNETFKNMPSGTTKDYIGKLFNEGTNSDKLMAITLSGYYTNFIK
ncbi:MAG: asparagine synthase-related protein [Oscillospiraceae bacterium]